MYPPIDEARVAVLLGLELQQEGGSWDKQHKYTCNVVVWRGVVGCGLHPLVCVTSCVTRSVCV